MKTYLRIGFTLLFVPLAFFAMHHTAHARYLISSYTFPNIDHAPNALNDYVPTKYLDGLASDIYYHSLSGACQNGNCGYPYSCASGGACGGNGSLGNFDCRVDKGHAFYISGGSCQKNGEQDDNYFRNGYPGQLMGGNNNYAANTAQRACQAFAAVDSGGAIDSTVTADYTIGSDNGDDGSYRNNISYMGSGWDIFEANHHYDNLNGDQRNSGNAITSLKCYSSAAPNQSITINGGSSATVNVGETANLSWADNDIYAGAGQTCTASTDNTDPNGGFTIPVPPASKFPYPTCQNQGGNAEFISGKSYSADPGQTSTLMSVKQNDDGDPLYQYGCESVGKAGGPYSPAGCQDAVSECDRWTVENGIRYCESYYTTAYCPVAPPDGSITVSASTPGTYHYHYNCKSSGGETDKTVTLTVQAGGPQPDLTAGNLIVDPSSPSINQPVTISALFTNTGASTTGKAFSDAFQIDPPNDPDHTNYQTVSTSSPALGAGESNTRSIVFNGFNQSGTWYLRACADSGNDIAESNETNNCTNGGDWVGVTVTGSETSLTCSVDTQMPVNAKDPVQLTAHPKNFSGTLTYTWTTDGGGNCGNAASCSAQYNTAGTYHPKVEVTDTANPKNDLTANCTPTVTVRPLCTVTPTSGSVPQNVLWKASNGGSYEWYDTLDNDLGSGSQYQHTYTDPGDYGAYVLSNGVKSTVCTSNLTSCSDNPQGTLSAAPTRVATGTPSQLTWSGVQGVPANSTCKIVSTPAGVGIDNIGTSDDSCHLNGNSVPSGSIITQTQFQLVCGGQDVTGASVVVDVAPNINEF
ncbi:MAG TPA: CARDB domain-containing protein [Candidatus Paceibacterota bacterium]|nr:CARDB domain-containing protein [Candidatus Paceibacterota bacterium]